VRKILLVAGFTLQEAVRRKSLLVLVLGCMVIVGGFWYGLHYTWTQIPPQMTPAQAEAIAYTAARMVLGFLNILVVVAGVFFGAGSIGTEIESGSMHLLLPRTITRTQVYLGKIMAQAFLIGSFSLVLVLGVGLAQAVSGPGWPPGWHWILLGFMLPPICLSVVAVGLSTRLSTVPAGLIGLFAFILAQAGTIIETIAATIDSEVLSLWGIGISLVVPVDAIYRWTIAQWVAEIGPAGLLIRTMGGLSGPTPSAWMLAWVVGWLIAVAGAGVWSFQTRDL